VAQKLAFLSVPDVSARLFVDALDDKGVFVDRAISLWHAMAMAWDPAGPAAAGGARGGEVVASSAPATAVVLVDPAGRLVWAWSRSGELLAAGSIRLVQERTEAAGAVVVGAPEIGRLATDWLGWSLQLGVAPARVVCVGPRTSEEGGLSQQDLGMTLGRLWPGATVDLAVHEDPIGATLHRLATMEEDPAIPTGDGRTALIDLSRRPGRAHRAVFRWASLAVLAGAAALLGVAWKGFSAAATANEEQRKKHDETIKAVTDVAAPKSALDQERVKGDPVGFLRAQIESKRKSSTRLEGIEPPKPILPELETLSMVLGSAGAGVELDQISMQNSVITLYVVVPDVATGEALAASLNDVAGSHVEWTPPSFDAARNRASANSTSGEKKVMTLFGHWKMPGAPASGAARGSGT
jgi:hypothetical protein